ncbi:glycosyltransferase family 9 protein [Streptomonospora nanhaiensis]|uniref:glycosyltransferase family 9 protein n=1 Tax=Streptomonospora nanhaiensis TaxID=1323731 RepID=UPI001C394D4F|nr:glycosyltransferase family 9 protein [Streptomonospora nanhaiensis]MBV2364446.1 glycosyltransferase family 9 protein [Streptomonospora nanhaiensis]
MADIGTTPDGFDGAGASGGGSGRLLVMRALGLGDFLTAVPALRALQRAFPGWRRYLAAPPAHADLLDLAGLAGWRIAPGAGTRAPEWAEDAPPDLAVNLHGRGPQSTRALLGLRPGRLWTHAHAEVPESAGGPAWPGGTHETDVWCRLLLWYGIAADPTDLRLPVPADTGVRPGGAGADRPDAVVVHPGAAAESRRWPPERFAAVARHLAARGHEVVVTGGAAEREIARRVAGLAGLGADRVLAGRTTLRRLARTVAGARLVVCGDTGVAHLATGYAAPSVVLFGPVDPALWGPRIDAPRHAVLWRGRTGDPHGAATDPGLLEIGVGEVIAAAEEVLSRCRPYSGTGPAHPPRQRPPAEAQAESPLTGRKSDSRGLPRR